MQTIIKHKDRLQIGGKTLTSRLFVGTGKYASQSMIPEVLQNSEAQVITVAVRRMDFNSSENHILDYIPQDVIVMPNTSGARNAEEAVRIARLARASGCSNWIKIEVIQDSKYLLPDGYETAKATEILANEGFTVLPYMNADLYIARSLRDAGAAAVMPLASPIGSNRGIRCEEMIQILINEIKLPVIADAGIGAPSQAARLMEMGAAACLVNTAIASARDPLKMAYAFKDAVNAGRQAYLAGTGSIRTTAAASSPITGFLYD